MTETETAARLAAIRERLEAGLYPGEANIAWLLGEVEQLTLERNALASAFCADCRDRLVAGWRYAEGTCVHCLGERLRTALAAEREHNLGHLVTAMEESPQLAGGPARYWRERIAALDAALNGQELS